MAGLFGGGKTQSTVEPKAVGLRVQTSAYGGVIPIVYGRTRIAGNLVWYGGFTAIPHTSKQSSGGKGGGGGSTNTSWTYTTSFILALSEGPIKRVNAAWRDKEYLPNATQTVNSDPEVATAQELIQVPPVPPYTVRVRHYADFIADLPGASNGSVSQSDNANAGGYGDGGNNGGGYGDGASVPGQGGYYSDGTPIGPAPPGQYTASNGVYTFNASLAGQRFLVSYTYNRVVEQGAVMSAYVGSFSQAPWPYLQSKFPDQAISYRGIAYVAAADYDLGSSEQLPNHTFDVTGMLSYDLSKGMFEANPKDVLVDLLTNPVYGAGFPADKIGDLTQFSNYCVANNLFMSPAFTDQAQAVERVRQLMTATNCDAYYSGGLLKVAPLSDSAASANGVTYTPVSSALYDLGDDDYITNTDSGYAANPPIRIERSPNSDAYNHIQVEYNNKNNQWNQEISEAKDAAAIEKYGLRTMDPMRAHEITDPAVARFVAQSVLQRQLYIRNKYSFRLGWKYCLLEPSDVVTLTSPALGLNKTPVRITSIDEDEYGTLSITAEDYPAGVSGATAYPSQQSDSYRQDYNALPGDVAPPWFFESYTERTKTGLAVGIATTGLSPVWGGCYVHVSYDGNTYKRIGQFVGGARYGFLQEQLLAPKDLEPQTAAVKMMGNNGQLLSAGPADLDNFEPLCLVDDEYVTYSDATLTAQNKYNLKFWGRGLKGSRYVSHKVNSPFIRIDEAVVWSDDLPRDMVGKDLHFKFCSYNVFGGGAQALEDVPAYKYTVRGLYAKKGPSKVINLGYTKTGDDVRLTWKAPESEGASKSSRITYDIKDGTGNAIGSAIATEFTVLDLPAGTTTLSVVAVDGYGNQSEPASVTVTINAPGAVTVTGKIQEPDYVLEWTAVQGDFALDYYEVRYGPNVGSTFAQSVLIDKVTTTSYRGKPAWTGERTFYVVAVDKQGNAGPPGSVAIKIDGPDGVSVTVDALGTLIIKYKKYNDPQIKYYEMRSGDSFETGTYVQRAYNGDDFTLPLIGSTGKTYWIKAVYQNGFSTWSYRLDLTGTALNKPSGITTRVSEPDLVFSWDAVPGASQYVALFEDGGVTTIRVTTDPQVSFHIPRWPSSLLRVIAVASNGTASEFTDQPVALNGLYSLNEVLNVFVPVTTGNYINMAFTTDYQIKRASLLGLNPLPPYAQNVNDGDLFSFGYNLESLQAINLQNIPAEWFRQDFWLQRNGYFESRVVDLGAQFTGRLLLNLQKNITFVGDAAVSAYQHVAAEYAQVSTVNELTDKRAFLTARFQVASDSANSVTWVDYNNGDWITNGRYLRIIVDVAMASPLTEITVTAASVVIDVPDKTESGFKTGVTSTATPITFTKNFTVVSTVIATPRGNVRAWVQNVTATGCDLFVDTTTPTRVDYFVKGY